MWRCICSGGGRGECRRVDVAASVVMASEKMTSLVTAVAALSYRDLCLFAPLILFGL